MEIILGVLLNDVVMFDFEVKKKISLLIGVGWLWLFFRLFSKFFK